MAERREIPRYNILDSARELGQGLVDLARCPFSIEVRERRGGPAEEPGLRWKVLSVAAVGVAMIPPIVFAVGLATNDYSKSSAGMTMAELGFFLLFAEGAGFVTEVVNEYPQMRRQFMQTHLKLSKA